MSDTGRAGGWLPDVSLINKKRLFLSYQHGFSLNMNVLHFILVSICGMLSVIQSKHPEVYMNLKESFYKSYVNLV